MGIIENSDTREKTNWRGVMDHQVTRYIRHVIDVDDYEPYRIDM